MYTNFYPSIIDWMNDCKPYFEHDEVYYQLMIINGNYLMSHDIDHAFFGICKEDQQFKLIFIYRPPYNLVVHPVSEMIQEDIIRFAEDVFEREPFLPGINGPEKLGKWFCDRYATLSDRHYERHLAMDIMMLRSLQPISLPKVFCKLAEFKDQSLIDQWTIAFSKEALHEVPDLVSIQEKTIERIAKQQCYLICDEDKHPKAMGLLTRPMQKGIAITLVYTDPTYRGKGYGMAVAYHLSKEAFRLGYEYITLYVDRANPISNRVYHKVGFEVVLEQSDYRFHDSP